MLLVYFSFSSLSESDSFSSGSGPHQADGCWSFHLPDPQQEEQLQSGTSYLQTVANTSVALSATNLQTHRRLLSFSSWMIATFLMAPTHAAFYTSWILQWWHTGQCLILRQEASRFRWLFKMLGLIVVSKTCQIYVYVYILTDSLKLQFVQIIVDFQNKILHSKTWC